MESVEVEIIKIKSKVSDLEERFRSLWVSGTGKDALFKKLSLGWYLHLQGSWEALYVGDSSPGWKVDDVVEITLERINDAKSSQPSV